MKYLVILFMLMVSSLIPQKIAAQASSIVAEDAKLIKIANHFDFTEGPAVDSRGNVYFTDQPNDQILKWSVDGGLEVFLTPSGRSNGLYFDAEDNLYACADALGQLWKIDVDKNIEVLLKDFQGKRLNGPMIFGLMLKEVFILQILFINVLIGNILFPICLLTMSIIYHQPV